MAKSPTFIHKFQMEDTSLCDELIEYHKAHDEYKISGQTSLGNSSDKISTDVGIWTTSNNKSIKLYMQHLMSAAQSYQTKYKFFKNPVELYPTFNIQHYKPNEGFFKYHCERNSIDDMERALVFMTYLNDVSYGGETEFYYQGIKVKPKKGLTLLWPTDFTHTHRGITSPTQEKYIATGWFRWVNLKSAIYLMNQQK